MFFIRSIIFKINIIIIVKENLIEKLHIDHFYTLIE
jgi:hypothetical protein